ncbi:protein mono-ADP-ribosyltransferase PARP15-like isoform X1 [Haliotis rufescens]|uniref:protein mono-ADP-ribosyltransferase PARP15-like isoform X1 n=1 Tax=Haliotis rufescens TaxID=6454 RepID=UPI00201F0BEE|nr:protein mono-ADP-ribosyltransferase PARP15-like isoform X1 [Haliotis rufescens]XP_048249258.1 protein mono-ADP-ribosyltransferase PARP15-like isoform X1 [Haliotis rufescens]XP_048249259.1 protein mono-ADP-ribosyltransferase PARP15-like isoform X1 [Haliotis rufescens]XP_048249260.1 protein mono-ADP-ribosyltransferase PARP15-like isoform X1 [Haliotis rufescens]
MNPKTGNSMKELVSSTEQLRLETPEGWRGPENGASYVNRRKDSAQRQGGASAEIGITVKVGNLAIAKADVIVNSTNTELDLSTSALSKAIVSVGGSIVQTQCKELFPRGMRNGDVLQIRTYVGKLRCKELHHCCLPNYKPHQHHEEVLRLTIHQCLQKASEAGHNSIAFPALGAGVRNYPPRVVTDVFRETIWEYSQLNPQTSLKEIMVVIFHKDQTMLKAFIDTFDVDARYWRVTTLTEQKTEFFQGYLQLEVKQGDILTECVDAIVVPADSMSVSESSLRATGAMILPLPKPPTKTVTTPRSSIEYSLWKLISKCLCKADKDKAMSLAITYQSGNTHEEFFILAFNKAIINNHEKFKCLRDVRLILAEPAAVAEAVQVFKETFGEASVRRYTISGLSILSNTWSEDLWDDMDDSDLTTPRVISGSEEEELTEIFRRSAGNTFEIVDILRIQNRDRYQQYQLLKQAMNTRPASERDIRLLWRGTNVEDIDDINAHGFDIPRSGDNDTNNGRGMSFATEASYATRDKYCHRDTNGIHYIYLCQVITGAPTKAEEKASDATVVVNDVETSSLYIVFRATHVYPQYLFAIKQLDCDNG